jgi:uncharacterized membrane protein
MKIVWRSELPHLAVLVALFAAAAIVWPLVPDRIPVHWNLAGEVDRYGGKVEGMLAVPLITFGMYWLLLFLPFIDPRRESYDQFRTTYLVMRWCLTLFMTVLYGLMLAAALGQPVDMGLSISTLMSVLFVALGLMLDKVQPNWFVGIRTPWTLSSTRSWTKTHRAAKWAFIVMGLTFLPLGWFKTPGALAVVLTTGLVGIAGLVIYSYFVWKDDPERLGSSSPQH